MLFKYEFQCQCSILSVFSWAVVMFCYTGAVAFGDAYFGELSLFNMTNVRCYGNESSLSECGHNRSNSCAANHTAGVRCLGEEVPGIQSSLTSNHPYMYTDFTSR